MSVSKTGFKLKNEVGEIVAQGTG